MGKEPDQAILDPNSEDYRIPGPRSVCEKNRELRRKDSILPKGSWAVPEKAGRTVGSQSDDSGGVRERRASALQEETGKCVAHFRFSSFVMQNKLAFRAAYPPSPTRVDLLF